MLQGLAVLLTAVVPSKCTVDRLASVTRTVPPEREFVRVLANMLLRTHSEAMHVY